MEVRPTNLANAIESWKPVNAFIPFTDLYSKMDCFAIVKGDKKKNREAKKKRMCWLCLPVV